MLRPAHNTQNVDLSWRIKGESLREEYIETFRIRHTRGLPLASNTPNVDLPWRIKWESLREEYTEGKMDRGEYTFETVASHIEEMDWLCPSSQIRETGSQVMWTLPCRGSFRGPFYTESGTNSFCFIDHLKARNYSSDYPSFIHIYKTWVYELCTKTLTWSMQTLFCCGDYSSESQWVNYDCEDFAFVNYTPNLESYSRGIR